MRIREIELDNFKSFGKRTVVPMLDGFTTISGPNGSGKSNIIDSLLFALGLSSTRSMRAERLPDLLNNLSGKNEAKVAVRFTDDKGGELEVTRRIRVKDNGYTSTYTLNGKNTTLSEVHDELQKYNVSPTGFNVIMQGDVTGIVTMSASDRRRIIDELAGVAEFDRRIDQANEELGAVAERIEHQKIVLVEIDVRLTELENDRNQALKYLDLKKQKEHLERDLIYIRVRDTENGHVREQKEIERLDQKEEQLAESREKAEVELFRLRSEMGRIDEEIREKGGHEQLLLRQELDNKRGEFTREENKLSNLNTLIAEKTKLQKSLTAQIKAIDKHLAELSKDKKQSDADLKAVEMVLMEKQGAFSAVQAEIEVLRQEKDKSSDKVTIMHDDLQKLREERHALEVKRTELQTRKESLSKELETMRATANNGINQSASIKANLLGLDTRRQDAYANVLGIERNIRQMQDEIESTNEDIENKRKDLELVNRRLVEVETHREVSGESGYGRAVEAILGLGMPGVYGTIGQLGRVQDDYVVALETCIGPRMGHIIVEDDEVAKQCIEYLKKAGGRATFVPLNKIVVQPPGLLPDRPGVIDFAYNLVDFDAKFTKAFQYACGQTIVMETMDSARRMITQARMVTLEGELFEKSGSITGGVDKKAKMHFSSKGETDLGVLQARSKALAGEIKDLQALIKELGVSIGDDQRELKEASAKLAQHQAELDAKRNEATKFDQEVEDIKPRLRTAADEIDQIDKDIDSIIKSVKELEREITRRQDELGDLTGGGFRSAIEKLIAEAEELQADLENIEKSHKDVQRQIDRIETEEKVELLNKTNLEEQLTTADNEIAELASQKPTFEQLIAELGEAIAVMEKQVSALSSELEKLRDEKDAIHDKVTEQEISRTKFEQDLIHLEEERQKRKLARYALEQELIRLKAELEQILSEQPDWKPPSDGNLEQIKAQVDRLEKRMRSLEPVNMKALDDYNHTKERQQELHEHLNTLQGEKDEIMQRISGYDELKKRTFMEAFDQINQNFQDIFAELSHGHGRLELEYPETPFAGGLIIRAQPRDKKMQRIEALSGGEKSLTALSFVFAFQRYAPAPFYAFDEVDMMLDGSNAERLARMVERQSKSAQFVVVSLRRPMIENADHAIGVSLRADGYSRVVGIKEVQIPTEEELQQQHGSAPQAVGV